MKVTEGKEDRNRKVSQLLYREVRASNRRFGVSVIHILHLARSAFGTTVSFQDLLLHLISRPKSPRRTGVDAINEVDSKGKGSGWPTSSSERA